MPWDLVSSAYAEDLRPQLEPFANDALRETGVGKGTRVLDVGAGPGTLAFAAARQGAIVTAVDFAPAMVDLLKASASREEIAVDARVGDATALPFEDGSFDAAFAMFVLIFLPDRAKGFREMHRVLRPGGRAAVTSWVPLRRTDPMFGAVFAALRERVPGLPPDDGRAPLGTTEEAIAEMTACGFADVRSREVTHEMPAVTPSEFWDLSVRSSAPFALMKKKMGDAWKGVDAGIRDELRAELGDTSRRIAMTGLLTSGARPT